MSSKSNKVSQLKAFFLISSIEGDISGCARKLADELKINRTSKLLNDPFQLNNSLRLFNDNYPDENPDTLSGIQLFISSLVLSSKVRVILNLSNALEEKDRNLFKDLNQDGFIYNIRNTVGHPDGLYVKFVSDEDLLKLIDLCRHILSKHKSIFKDTNHALSEIDKNPDEEELFRLSGLSTFEPDRFLVNNSPNASYTDTGFVGRQDLIRDVLEELDLNTPIITIFGEGGLGKTALVRKIVERIEEKKDDLENFYEVIWWHSSKQEELTYDGLKSIDSDKLEELPKEIQAESGYSLEVLKEDITKNNAKILFILDNLETDLAKDRNKTIDFVDKLRKFGQIIITSRTRLGKLEQCFRIEPFSLKDTKTFLRNIAKKTNNSQLLKAGDDLLEKWGKELNYSPLFLKLFAFGIREGLSAETFLSVKNKKNITNYVYNNVFDTLSKEARQMLFVLRQLNKPASQFEILTIAKIFENEGASWNQDTLNEARLNLTSSCFIEDEYTRGEQLTKITDLALSYIKENQVKMFEEFSDSIFKKISAQIRDLRTLPPLNKYSKNIFETDYFILNDETSSAERTVAREINEIYDLWNNYTQGKDDEGAYVHPEWESVEKRQEWVRAYKIEKALELASRYQSLEENGAQSPALYRAWGLMLSNANQIEGAKEKFFKAFEISNVEEGKAQILHDLAIICQRDRDYSEAKRFAKELNDIVNSSEMSEPKAALTLASIHHDSYENEQALNLVDQVEKNEIEKDRSLYLKTIFYYRMKFNFFEFNETENLPDKINIIEKCFQTLSKKISYTVMDDKNTDYLFSMIAQYIRYCKELYEIDKEKLPSSINTLFQESKYKLDENRHRKILDWLEENNYADYKNTITIPLQKHPEIKEKKYYVSSIEQIMPLKKFGFISETENSPRLFFHFSDVNGDPNGLAENSKVSFKVTKYRGRFVASDVRSEAS